MLLTGSFPVATSSSSLIAPVEIAAMSCAFSAYTSSAEWT